MTPAKIDKCEFEVTQNGATVARGSGSHDAAVAEAMHYAMMYGQEGPVNWTVHKVTRTPAGRLKRELTLRGSMAGLSFTIGESQ